MFWHFWHVPSCEFQNTGRFHLYNTSHNRRKVFYKPRWVDVDCETCVVIWPSHRFWQFWLILATLQFLIVVWVLNTVNSNKRIGIFSAEIFTILRLLHWEPPNLIAGCEFKPFWFTNWVQLSIRIYGKLVCREIYMLAEIVGSSLTPGSHLRHNDITEWSRKPKNTSCWMFYVSSVNIT